MSKLFEKALDCLPSNPEEAYRHFKVIKDELESHAKAEEEVLFHPLMSRLESYDAEAVVLEGEQEHHVFALLLKELSQIDCHAPEWGAKLTVLSELVEHHVEEEERDIFPKAKEIFSGFETENMATELVKTKAAMKTQVDSLLSQEAKILANP